MTRAAWIRQQAARPQGVTAAEVAEVWGLTPHVASAVISVMRRKVRCPLLVAVITGHRARYFTSEADRAAYVAATPALTPDSEEKRALYYANRRAKVAAAPRQARQPRPPKADPTTAPIKRQTPAVEVDYSRAKLTVCPSPTHDHRYQVAPGAEVWGAGFRAVGIGRDVRTGGAWA